MTGAAAVIYLVSVAGIAGGLIEGRGRFHGRCAALLFLAALMTGLDLAIGAL